jgi:hypothetical protein
MQHGNHRNADVDLATRYSQLDAAVLRNPFLGDIQPGHDLQTADDGCLKPVDLGRGRLRLQDPVDPVADLHARVLRLQVNVARPSLDRLAQDLVHQPYHGSFLSRLGRLRPVPFHFFQDLDAVRVLFADRDQIIHRLRTDSQMSLHQPSQFVRHRNQRGHTLFDRRTDRIDRCQVERIACGNQQGALSATQGKHPIAMNEPQRKAFESRQIHLERRQIDVLHSQHVANGTLQILDRRKAQAQARWHRAVRP